MAARRAPVMGKTSLLNVVIEWVIQERRLSVLQLPHVSPRDAFVEEVLDGIAAEAHTSRRRLGLRDARGRLRLSTITEYLTKALLQALPEIIRALLSEVSRQREPGGRRS